MLRLENLHKYVPCLTYYCEGIHTPNTIKVFVSLDYKDVWAHLLPFPSPNTSLWGKEKGFKCPASTEDYTVIDPWRIQLTHAQSKYTILHNIWKFWPNWMSRGSFAGRLQLVRMPHWIPFIPSFALSLCPLSEMTKLFVVKAHYHSEIIAVEWKLELSTNSISSSPARLSNAM